MHLAVILLLLMPGWAAMAQVEVVRPVPRAAGQHGFTIEVPTPGAYGGFEVLRGGRVPPAMADDEALAPAPPAAAISPRGIAPFPVAPVQMAPVQVAPVRPVELAPAGNARGDARTVRVQRGPFARPPLPAEAAQEAAPDMPLPALPPGARVIRIR